MSYPFGAFLVANTFPARRKEYKYIQDIQPNNIVAPEKDVMDISLFIVANEWNNGRSVSTLRLMNLLYFAQVYCITNINKKCFCEDILAFDFGPVIYSIYIYFYRYIADAISFYELDIENIHWLLPDNIRNCIYDMCEECSKFSNPELQSIIRSHKPWILARKNNSIISIESIKEYYSFI